MSASRHHISVDKVRGCIYHLADWVRVAALACELVTDLGPRLTAADVTAAGEGLVKSDAFWLWSLFDDPIAWYPGAATLTNGQHRACGLWFSGADWVPVAPARSADSVRH